MSNLNDFTQPYVAVFVRMEAAALAPGGQQAPRTIWVPEAAGDYTARAFIISGISAPEVLSATQSASFAVQ
jgi:hypothetical protein